MWQEIFMNTMTIAAPVAVLFPLTIHLHELGHRAEHIKAGDTDFKMRFKAVAGDKNESLNHTPEQEIAILEGGYKRNKMLSIVSIPLVVGGFIVSSMASRTVGIAPTELGNVMIQTASQLLWSIPFAFQACNFTGYMLNKYSFNKKNPSKDVHLDGNKVKAIRKYMNIYENEPTIANKLKLEIAKLQGDFTLIPEYKVDIKDNMAYITSYDAEHNLRESVLIYDKDKDNGSNRGFSLYNRNTSEIDEGFIEALDKFNKIDENKEKLVEIYKEPEFRFTSEKKSKVIPVKKEPVKDKGMDI